MRIPRLRLSKSRYVSGLQCHKRQWWEVHEPDAPELKPDLETQARLDQGTRVGELARGHVPGGILIDVPHEALERRLDATAAALGGGAPAIYEAAFFADGIFVAVDILERAGRAFHLVEVKSTTRVKDEHVPDAAVQAHVLRRSGLEVARTEVMHLNRECAYPDLGNLFLRQDVTPRVERHLPRVPDQARAQLRALAGPLPEVPIGDHCVKPHPCPFMGRCWPHLPDHHVGTLYKIGVKAAELEAQGYATIDRLPDHLALNPQAARQRRAVKEGRLVVEPGLAEALAAFEPPLAFLDFETVMPAVPVWPGCHPYDPVPVQFSCDAGDGRDRLAHHEWITLDASDPRPELVRRIAAACRGARAIVAYNAPFETRCLRLIGAALPQLAGTIEDICSRIRDALPVVRDHVYHPDFGGGFGLKAVLPALVPALGYAGLEIAEGHVASVHLARLLFEPDRMSGEEAERLRADLLRYCALDTLGLARLLARLRELA